MRTQTEDLAAVVLASIVVAVLTWGIDNFASSSKSAKPAMSHSWNLSSKASESNNEYKKMDALLEQLGGSIK